MANPFEIGPRAAELGGIYRLLPNPRPGLRNPPGRPNCRPRGELKPDPNRWPAPLLGPTLGCSSGRGELKLPLCDAYADPLKPPCCAYRLCA
jgi:hypothetical protein